jgi:hypothetical protein
MLDEPRPITTYKEVRVGTKLRADGGFSCISKGQVLVVNSHQGDLFVACDHGMHFLDGQCDDRRGGYEGFEPYE